MRKSGSLGATVERAQWRDAPPGPATWFSGDDGVLTGQGASYPRSPFPRSRSSFGEGAGSIFSPMGSSVGEDDVSSLPLDRVSIQPSLLGNGNAPPAYHLPEWASDSGNDPEGWRSRQTFLNVPEQMNPFLKADATYGVLPGTILSAADMAAVTAGRTIPAQIMSRLQTERMMAGGPLAGHADLDGEYLRRYLTEVEALDRSRPATGQGVVPAPTVPDPGHIQAPIPSVRGPWPDRPVPQFSDLDLSQLYRGWQY